MPFIISRF
jgi:hypothetical protein